MKKFCGKCGYEIEDGEGKQFCPRCGNLLGGNRHPNQLTDHPSNIPRAQGGDLPVMAGRIKKACIFIAAAVIFIAIAVFVRAPGKKAKQIAEAYENTVNADNFRVAFFSTYFGGMSAEVYGKGNEANDVVITFFPESDVMRWDDGYAQMNRLFLNGTLPYSFRYDKNGNVFVVWSGDYGYNSVSGERISLEDEGTYFMEAVAKRDIPFIYDYCGGEILGWNFMESFSYEQIQNLFFNKFFNYVIGKQEDNIIEEMSVKDGIYTITARFFPLCQALEEQDESTHDIAKAVLNSSIFDFYLSESQVSRDAPWEAIEDELKNIRVKVELKLDGKYIKYIRVCMENPDMPVNSEISREQVFFYLQFDDVNEISEKDSVGWQAINSY